MKLKSKRIWDMRNFKGETQDENWKEKPEYALF